MEDHAIDEATKHERQQYHTQGCDSELPQTLHFASVTESTDAPREIRQR
jgi:hypothetical protein